MNMTTHRSRKVPQTGRLRNLLLATTAFVAFSNIAQAQTWEWDGGVSTDWFEAGNWTPAVEPDGASDVFINNSANNSVLLDQGASVSSLHIGSGTGSDGKLNLISYGDINAQGFIGIGTDGGKGTVNATTDYYASFYGDSFNLGINGGIGELVISTLNPGGANVYANGAINIGTGGGNGKLTISGASDVNISGSSLNIGRGAGSTGVVEITASPNSSGLYGQLSSHDDRRVNIGKDGGNGTLKIDFGELPNRHKNMNAPEVAVGDGIGSEGLIHLLGSGKDPSGSSSSFSGFQSTHTFIGMNGGTGHAIIEDIGWAVNGGNHYIQPNSDTPSGIHIGYGAGSVGTVDILSGGKLSSAYYAYYDQSRTNSPAGIIIGEGGTGTVNVSGSNQYASSLLASGKGMIIGTDGGFGEVNVREGAEVASYDIRNYVSSPSEFPVVNEIGVNGGTGILSVIGAGSAGHFGDLKRNMYSEDDPGYGGTTGDLIVGASGNGTLVLSDGGTVNVGVVGVRDSSMGITLVKTIGNGIVYLGRDTGSNGTIVYGSLPGVAPTAVGILNADGIVFGQGSGSITFNHTDTNYQFDKPISGEGAFDVYAGTTWISRDNRVGFTHQRDVYDPNEGTFNIVDETFSDGFSGFTRLRGGTLGLANDGALGTSIIQGLADSTLIYGTDPVSGGGVNILNTMEINDGVELSLQTGAGIGATQAGIISGAGGFRKTGEGTLTLTADNTLTGQVTVAEGVLALSGDGEVSQAARVVTDATFDITNATDGASIRSLAGSGSVTLGAETLTITAADDTFSGVISGSGGLTLTGGTQTLSGDNTLTGEVSIEGGTLALSGNGEVSQAARVVADGTFDITNATDGASIRSLAGNGSVTLGAETLTITAADDTFAGVISGSGGLTLTGGTQTLAGDNTLTGQVTIENSTLALSGAGEVSQAARVVADGTFDISAATDGASIRSLAGGGSVVLGTETLTLTAADDLFSGVISGSGGLNLTGGTETLSGANTYSGETRVSDGILRAGATGTFSPNSVHDILSGGVLDMAGYNQTVAGMSNAGTVLMDGAPGTVLTVAGNYVGNGGSIYMNTTLGSDNSVTDRLVIDGGRASGTTTLMITNILGNGALTTGNGIPVVVATNGGSAADATFIQGTRLAAGAYEYTLHQNGIGASSSDGNWYLRNTREEPIFPPYPGTDPGEPIVPPLVPEPDYREEVPLAASLPPIALEYGYSMLGTMHERTGENYGRVSATPPVYEDRVIIGKDGKRTLVRFPSKQKTEPSQFFNGAWARLIGDRGLRDNNNFQKNGPNYDYTFAGIQAGLDLYGSDSSFDGGTDTAGVYIGYGQINARVKGAYEGRAGSVNMDAYTVGAYWTHRSPIGWYSDAVIQGTWYSTDASSFYGQKLKPDGFGIIASLEGGHTFRMSNSLIIEPQVQIAYQNTSFDSVNDAYGRFSFNDGESLRGRVGIRVANEWNTAGSSDPRMITTWVRANLWHEFLGDTHTTVSDFSGFNGVVIPSSLGGTWGEIGAGISAQVSSQMTLFATGAYNRSLDNKGREAWNGRLGITYRW